jgi:hypothetical protein
MKKGDKCEGGGRRRQQASSSSAAAALQQRGIAAASLTFASFSGAASALSPSSPVLESGAAAADAGDPNIMLLLKQVLNPNSLDMNSRNECPCHASPGE